MCTCFGVLRLRVSPQNNERCKDDVKPGFALMRQLWVLPFSDITAGTGPARSENDMIIRNAPSLIASLIEIHLPVAQNTIPGRRGKRSNPVARGLIYLLALTWLFCPAFLAHAQ